MIEHQGQGFAEVCHRLGKLPLLVQERAVDEVRLRGVGREFERLVQQALCIGEPIRRGIRLSKLEQRRDGTIIEPDRAFELEYAKLLLVLAEQVLAEFVAQIGVGGVGVDGTLELRRGGLRLAVMEQPLRFLEVLLTRGPRWSCGSRRLAGGGATFAHGVSPSARGSGSSTSRSFHGTGALAAVSVNVSRSLKYGLT